MEMISLLKKLTAPMGVSGCEKEAAKVCLELAKGLCDEAYINNRGSVVGKLLGKGPTILLDAHLDQVGLIVTGIEDNGFLKVDKCGGIDERILAAQPVEIYGKEKVMGVISSIPPHLAKKEDAGKAKPAKDMCIDTGLSKEDCERLISLGDRVRIVHPFEKLLGNEVLSGALDDRSGIAILLRTLEILKNQRDEKKNKNVPTVIVTFSVCEEVGGKGAATAAYPLEKIDSAIAVDVSFDRTPGCEPQDAGKIGKGPMIGHSPVLDRGISKKLEEIAKDMKIPYQLEIMASRTGTHGDELAVLKSGVKTGIVSIPLKHMHTPIEIINLEDIENSAKLISEFCLRGGADHE